ncbi:MAG: zinc dependent phospholipase C family protein [Silvibacterium sp.]|nr:zinc dependent phospholipase C family protein [Silvibacterium sp.]
MARARAVCSIAILLLFLLFSGQSGFSYSVLTHEQLIDLAWKDSIVPMLLSRYPHTTPAELERARAFAYGGCAIQDAGYYPFGHMFFADLTHYVRSGDFVASLIRNSRDVYELAFALGALSHYVGDVIGHHDAINPSTAAEFPNLEKKYGPVITYEESRHAHIRTEFAFDINQLSKRRMAPSAYLNHVGLEVSMRLLEHAFFETYGLHLRNMDIDRRAAETSYRRAVRNFIPSIARAEVYLHRKSFPEDQPGPEFDRYAKSVQEADAANGWEQYRKGHFSMRTRLLAFVIVVVPKVGIFSDLAIRGPNQQTEAKYIESVNRTLERYQQLVGYLTRNPTVEPRATMNLDNRDLDTGDKVRPGGYRLTDETYAKLLGTITALGAPIPVTLKRDLLNYYYRDPAAPIATKKNKEAWQRVQEQLAELKTMPVIRRDFDPEEVSQHKTGALPDRTSEPGQ